MLNLLFKRTNDHFNARKYLILLNNAQLNLTLLESNYDTN